MANTRSRNRRSSADRGGSKRTNGAGALVDTVRNTLTQMTGNRRRSSGGGGLASKATGVPGGLFGGSRDSGARRRR